jgi:hypothetical protein
VAQLVVPEVVVQDPVATASVVRLEDLVETDTYSMELLMVAVVVVVAQLLLLQMLVLLLLHTVAMAAALEAETRA